MHAVFTEALPKTLALAWGDLGQIRRLLVPSARNWEPCLHKPFTDPENTLRACRCNHICAKSEVMCRILCSAFRKSAQSASRSKP